jgi:hypothetical protein
MAPNLPELLATSACSALRFAVSAARLAAAAWLLLRLIAL